MTTISFEMSSDQALSPLKFQRLHSLTQFCPLPAGAITVWVGYDDNEETSIKFTYPVDSSSEPMPGDGLSDYHLETLELLIIDNAELLDSRVYDFANAITNFLQAIEDHPSFRDEKRLAWLASKVKLEKEAALYKSYVITSHLLDITPSLPS